MHHLNLLPLLATVALALVPVPVKNLTQLVNHNGNDGKTFLQQYQLDTTFFKSGGPILFKQGNEDAQPITNMSVYGDVIAEFASDLGGINATLEHRFFGHSWPNPVDTSPASYAALTLDNILGDSVAFIQHIKKTVPGAENSRVIVTGSSYSGFLSTMLRVKHPDVFYGALASSPQLRGWGPATGNPYAFSYYDWISNVYYDLSAEASEKIKAALSTFSSCIARGDCPSAIPNFSICNLPKNATEWKNLYGNTIFNYRYITQYNLPRRGMFPQTNPLQLLINATLQANSTSSILRLTHQMMTNMSVTSTECVKVPPLDPIKQAIALVGPSQAWVACSIMPKLQDYIPESKLFPAQEGSRAKKRIILTTGGKSILGSRTHISRRSRDYSSRMDPMMEQLPWGRQT